MSAEPGSGYAELVRWAYLGEIFGAAFLAQLIESGGQPGHESELELLHQLEELTCRRLAKHIHPAEMREQTEEQLAAAETFASSIAGQSWHGFMRETSRIAQDALPLFNRLATLAPPDAADDMQAVLDHEHSLLEFADQQLAGIPSKSSLVRHLRKYGPTAFSGSQHTKDVPQ